MMSEIASVQSVCHSEEKETRKKAKKNDLNFSVENFFDRKNIFFFFFFSLLNPEFFEFFTHKIFASLSFLSSFVFSMHFFGGVFLCSFLSLHMRF